MPSFILPMCFGPTFRKEDFYQAIVNYQQRERRFGKTGEQIKQNA